MSQLTAGAHKCHHRKQLSAKTSYLNAINLNEFIKNEWKWEKQAQKKTHTHKRLEKKKSEDVKRCDQKDCHFETYTTDKISQKKRTKQKRTFEDTQKHLKAAMPSAKIMILEVWPHASKFIGRKSQRHKTRQMRYLWTISHFRGHLFLALIWIHLRNLVNKITTNRTHKISQTAFLRLWLLKNYV